jgi:sortase B
VESTDYQYQTYVRVDPVTKEETVIDAREFNEYDELMEQMATDYFNIYDVNSDIVGWLNIPNIGYYPVTMGEDNQYYLTHNEYKEAATAGIPFMNTASGGSFKDIALIHGHHMKNGSMFGSLSKYKDEMFFQTNDKITVFDGEYLYVYQPFSVTLYEDGTGVPKVNSMTKEERLEYLNSLKDASMVKMADGVEIDLNNQILFLSTCDYTFTNARLLVGSVMVEKYKYTGDK